MNKIGTSFTVEAAGQKLRCRVSMRERMTLMDCVSRYEGGPALASYDGVRACLVGFEDVRDEKGEPVAWPWTPDRALDLLTPAIIAEVFGQLMERLRPTEEEVKN